MRRSGSVLWHDLKASGSGRVKFLYLAHSETLSWLCWQIGFLVKVGNVNANACQRKKQLFTQLCYSACFLYFFSFIKFFVLSARDGC